MPPPSLFISYAQNREDVVLWRALGHLPAGRYIEIGANHPQIDSVTKAFYDRGWSGITVEPMHQFVVQHRKDRPRDTMVEAVINNDDTDVAILHEIADTGLSSIVDSVGAEHRAAGRHVVDRPIPALRLTDLVAQNGGLDQDVHFLLVDTEGAEPEVLASVDLRTFRPWVLVIESTAPNSVVQTQEAWEGDVLAAGYRFCLFDGLSRFYVAEEHAEELQARLSYPACALDSFVDSRAHAIWEEALGSWEFIDLADRQELIGDVRRWRAEALRLWAVSSAATAAARRAAAPKADPRLKGELAAAKNELAAVRATVSWRVTRPIRVVRRVLGRP